MKAKTAREQQIINEYEEKIKAYDEIIKSCRAVMEETASAFGDLSRQGIINASVWQRDLMKVAESLKRD